MTAYISQKEADELCSGMFCDYYAKWKQTDIPVCIDIEGFITEYLGATVTFENIREDEGDVLAFTADGIHSLRVYRNGKTESILFPKKTIVVDQFLLRPEESARRRFALAHEAGHLLDEHISPQPAFQREYVLGSQYSFKELQSRMNIAESHADRIGVGLLLPRSSVENALKKYNAGRRLPIYGTHVFARREKVILGKMKNALGVSYTMLLNRLRHFDMLYQHELGEYIEKELRAGGAIL